MAPSLWDHASLDDIPDLLTPFASLDATRWRDASLDAVLAAGLAARRALSCAPGLRAVLFRAALRAPVLRRVERYPPLARASCR